MIDISVIIPIYKGEKYLDYWIDILAKNFSEYQKEYKEQCEVIFVNDYPEEKAKLPDCGLNATLYHLEKNQGIHGARVFGYRKAKGTYIVFLDQDDKIAENYLVCQRKCIGLADAVVCNGYRERLWMRGRWALYTQNEQLQRIEDKNFLFMGGNAIKSPGQVLIKKSSVPELWLTEIIKENGADDLYLWILMKKEKCIFQINNQKLYTYMEYGSNTSNQVGMMKKSMVEMISILDRNRIWGKEELERLREKNESNGTANRYLQMIRAYDYWMYLKIRGKTVSQFLVDCNYKRIAIYGMNYFGNRLYDDLYRSDVCVAFGIDKNAESIEYDIPIYTLDSLEVSERIKDIDAVIVTVIDSFHDILGDLRRICEKPVMSIVDMFLDMMKLNEIEMSGNGQRRF